MPTKFVRKHEAPDADKDKIIATALKLSRLVQSNGPFKSDYGGTPDVTSYEGAGGRTHPAPARQ